MGPVHPQFLAAFLPPWNTVKAGHTIPQLQGCQQKSARQQGLPSSGGLVSRHPCQQGGNGGGRALTAVTWAQQNQTGQVKRQGAPSPSGPPPLRHQPSLSGHCPIF